MKIAVLGAGSWGTALAIQLARQQHQIWLWGHEPETMDQVQQQRQNAHYLPGIHLPETIQATADLEQAVQADHYLIVVPSHAFEIVLKQLKQLMPDLPGLCWATKGLLPQGQRLLHEVAQSYFPLAQLAVLSGPTFALEVAKGLPTAIALACQELSYGQTWAKLLHSAEFRVYINQDLIGVQIGGAAKNIMAIAAGISDGLGFGANARAALITRGLAEITRLGTALGGQAETFRGLAGLGDLVLTCTDDLSRNRRLGLGLARGFSIEQLKQQIGQEIEGLAAAKDIRLKAQNLGVDMPITEQVYQVLYQRLEPEKAVRQLLARQSTVESPPSRPLTPENQRPE